MRLTKEQMREIGYRTVDRLIEHFDTLTGRTFDAIAALNTAFVTDGAVVDIPAGTRLEKPLLLVHLAAGKEPRASTVRHRITVGADASATIVELYLTLPGSSPDQQVNALTEIASATGRWSRT